MSRKVINADTGKNVTVLNSRKNMRFVKVNNSNFWYRVIKGKYIMKQDPQIYDNITGEFRHLPNNNSNRMKVYATVPSGYATNKNGRIYKLANFPANQNKHAGLTINVERNGRGQEWRLVNKNLANKFNLKMKMSNDMGMWWGQLFNKRSA